MVIRGKTRGNGRQLADYLLRSADNDNVRVLGIRGTSQPDSLKYSLIEMSLTSELTKSSKGLYHAQLNPAYGEDRQMMTDDWFKAADILEAEAGFIGQKRVIVLHEKKGRIHAHVVWERYDHEKGIMKSDSFNRLAQDRARKEMERVFEHSPTPDRNKNRPEMKKRLTEMWRTVATGQEFINQAEAEGYQLCKGTQRPFMVVDETGRSFDLLRQLEGIRTRDVRERMKDLELQTEKQAIHSVRIKQNAAKLDQAQEDAKEKINRKKKAHFSDVFLAMKEESHTISGEKNRAIAKAFQENTIDETSKATEIERKRKLQEFKEQFLQGLKDKTRTSDHEPEQ